MTNEERITDVKKLGYTQREATFLCLAALHGGYFLRRHYNTFLGLPPSGLTEDFIKKAMRKGHVKAHPTNSRTLVYHIGSRPFFEVLGEEENRNRRWRQPYSVKIKLMGLDYVLAHRQHTFLATESEKIGYFDSLGIERSCLPIRFYQSKNGRATTQRFFVDKFPLYLSGAPDAPASVVNFCFVDASERTPGEHMLLPGLVM